ncbi:MAG: hypothetical protein P4M04_11095 [Acidobacteriota bacterium]|nr:hypothetical protein [Acidobacteriota bacterium]
MNLNLHLIDYVLWFFAPTIQVGVLVAMYRRGLHREYPYFFNYIILQAVSEPILAVLLKSSYAFYYWGYWISAALSALVSFAVLQEIFKSAFRPYEALRDLGVILFRWSALVILLVAGMWAISSSGQTNQVDMVRSSILLVERSIRLMQCGLVFFLLLFSEYLGISRRNMLFGIALGFGVFASVSMLVAAVMAHPWVGHLAIMRWIRSATYDLAVVVWMGYTLLAPARSEATLTTVRSKEWNDALENAHQQAGADSLLDTMDRTVERLLYPRDEAKVSVTAGD